MGAFSVPGVGSDLTSCNYPFGVLPVYWAGFAATLQNNNSMLLTWSISQQINNIGFNIQRSKDETWENIGFQVNNPDESSLTYSCRCQPKIRHQLLWDTGSRFGW